MLFVVVFYCAQEMKVISNTSIYVHCQTSFLNFLLKQVLYFGVTATQLAKTKSKIACAEMLGHDNV